ncbi:MAG TPA: integrase core domain-containing protein, partial [Hyphomicrobiaceae bacterium]|nr:integrase core domain-containing protein [Hyphomicrobiaceae bacterium]
SRCELSRPRYERATPGEIIHIDIKKLGHFNAIGHRITGDRTRQSNQRRDELPRWLHRYNWHRPHASLGGKPPISRHALSRNNLLRYHS